MVQLNKTSVGKLMREFGYDSRDWIGRSVLLTAQEGLIDNKNAAWINVEPLADVGETAPKTKPKLMKTFP
jgi:hypothetical protein